VLPFGRSNVSTWRVRLYLSRHNILHSGTDILFHRTPIPELQGHAIKNQDLLIASGTISLKGSEGMTAVDEDIEAAVSLSF